VLLSGHDPLGLVQDLRVHDPPDCWVISVIFSALWNQIVSALSLMVLPHQVQDLCIHDPSDCWVISGFISVAYVNTPMSVHSRHNSSKVNRKVRCRFM
jgi:hypothetical protein